MVNAQTHCAAANPTTRLLNVMTVLKIVYHVNSINNALQVFINAYSNHVNNVIYAVQVEHVEQKEKVVN